VTAALRTLPPGSVIGMLGGGQLGRMTAIAAAQLGYRVHVFTDETDAPCAQVCASETVAPWNDEAALARFAAAVDVVTLEWENIPTASLQFLEQRVPTCPAHPVLSVTQDRVAEKRFANRLGIGTAPFRPVSSPAELAAAVAELGRPSILKSNRLGYDGKGQVRLEPGTDLAAAWATMGAPEGVLEGLVDFACEVSVIVARRADGVMAAYPAVENRHAGGILRQTIAPAEGLDPAIAAEAERIARALTQALDVVGLLAVEMFVTRDGRVLVNEMAPRPHNSGHWTLDFAVTSQFEQLVRAVCGLPLGDTAAIAPCVMTNLIGDDVAAWPAILAEPHAHLHLYGKAEVRAGRKMGHVTRPR
jgi:5-(carboxyamino)imidazole ribonucleotide synthase